MGLLPVARKDRSNLAKFYSDMDELFNTFSRGWEMPFLEHGRWPVVDIADSENEFVVRAEVPGCKAEDIDISVHGNTLTISGEKKQEEEKSEKGYYHIERCYGSFRRDLTLPVEVDSNKIDAVCKDGVLSITLPKAERAKAVKVRVKER